MNQLHTLREEFEDKLKILKETIPREVSFKPIKDKISVFIGMRRTGKTTFVLQQIIDLLEDGIPITQIFYANFEDDRLMSTDHKVLVDLCDAFYSLYPENHDKHCYLFFDEIQNVPNWPKVIRRFFDTKRVSIYLTGSSAKLLSKEIATSLRGRSLSTEIWPFSFTEFLLSKKIEYSVPMGKKTYDGFVKLLEIYLHIGGFPEVISVTSDTKNRILQDYVNAVIMRDIIERYNISNIILIHYIIKSLLKNVGTSFSINKFFNDVKTQGISASKNTLYEYLKYIEDAYLIFSVPIYAESIRKVQTNPKKIYAIDPGLVGAYTLSMSPNYGHLFENLVFLDLKRKNHEVYYYLTKEGYEIDFLSKTPQGKIKLWQVVWDLKNEKTMQRELRALHSAEKELGVKGELVTPENYLTFLQY
jgi:predicted AAA+ superfamily ATPase